MLPNAQSKPPLAQLWTTPVYTREKSSPPPSTNPLLSKLKRVKASLQSLFLYTREAQSPQPLLIGHLLCSFQQFCGPPLDALKYFYILLKHWGPQLHAFLKARPQPCWIVCGNNWFCSFGYALFNAPPVCYLPSKLSGYTANMCCTCCIPVSPGPFLSGCFSVTLLPICTCAQWYCPRCRILLLRSECSNLPRSLCRTTHPSRESAVGPSLESSSNPLIVHNFCIQIVGHYTEQYWHLYWALMDTNGN